MTSVVKATKPGPSKLTPELQEQILTAIRKGGCTYADACLQAGISTSTFHLWKQKGQEQKKGRFFGVFGRAEKGRGRIPGYPVFNGSYTRSLHSAVIAAGLAESMMEKRGRKALPRCGMRNHLSKWETRRWRKLRLKVFELDGHRCRCCGKAGVLELDHIAPVEKGGESVGRFEPADPFERLPYRQISKREPA